MSEGIIKAIAIGIFAGLCFLGGWAAEGWRKDAEIARINQTHQADKARETGVALLRISAANKLADELTLQVAGWEQTLTAFAQEKNNELARLVTGRRCLDGAAVRVLNRPSPQLGGALSQTTSFALRAATPVAAHTDDGAFASDEDVAGWVGQCQRGYETCRGRLGAIADFYHQAEQASE